MAGYDGVVKRESKGSKGGAAQPGPIARLAAFAADTALPELPPEVIEHTKRVLLDTLGVILGGTSAPEAAAMARRYGRTAGDGARSTIIGHRLYSSVLNAALVNGTAATWLDYDSGHRPPPGKPLLPAAHPPVHLIPAAMAVAEALGVSGKGFLPALVVGYDAGARIGLASRLRAPVHCHGTYHNISAAVAAGRLKGFDAALMARTIGLATHLTMLTSFENAYQGGTVRNVYAGAGAAMGVLASQLATAGFVPEKDAIGSVFGVVASPWLDRERIVEGLGERFEITQGFIKLYAMCRFGHPAIEAAERFQERYNVPFEDIEDVQVDTFDWAATLDEREPVKDLGAKFSVPWGVASMLVRRSAGMDDFSDEALTDERVRSVSAKTSVKEDPAYSAMTPQKRPARITLRTTSGRVYRLEVMGSSGGPDAPLSIAVIRNKFRSLAVPVVGVKQAETIIEMVDDLESLPDMRELTRLLRPEEGLDNGDA